MEGKVLKKSKNKIFCGVCGGLADYLGVDYTIMRLIYAVLSICSAAFPGLLIYLILALLMPEDQ